MCARVQQFPMAHVVAVTNNDVCIWGEITDVVDQVSRCVVIWQHKNHNTGMVNASVLQNLCLRRVTQNASQAVTIGDGNVVWVQIDDNDATLMRVYQALRNALASGSKTNYQDGVRGS
jgi:hypothetical protein